MFINLIITGYSILLGAILANILADFFTISTWYTFLQNILKIGLTETIRHQKITDLFWLFFIYPIILSSSYMLGNKLYDFLIQ